MQQEVYSQQFGTNPAENYQRYFVPSIGGPVAEDLIKAAALRPGERVLDVACGTGVVTRLAAAAVGSEGSVAGLDINPAMIAVARSVTPSDMPIAWHEASAESMPLDDNSFDVVLCQMGLQFMQNKLAALRETRRVLDSGGRAYLTLPGPKPSVFGAMTDGLARHISPAAASFGDLVFSMHDGDELTGLMRSVGFKDIAVHAAPKRLELPAPRDFLWQYIYSTPMAGVAAETDDESRNALERDVCARWQDHVKDGHLQLEVGMTTVSGVK